MATPEPTAPRATSPAALDYQHPATPGRGNAATVSGLMLKREKNFKRSWATLAIIGALVSVAGAAIPASIAWVLQLRYKEDPAPWMRVYFWTVLVAVPLAFVLEHLTRGTMLQDAASDIDYSSGFELELRGRAVFGMFIIDMCLWGPRMVMAGIKRLRRRGEYARADRDLAARLLAMLYQREEGMETGELFAAAAMQSASDETFGDALAYLAFFDWIGIAKNGRRSGSSTLRAKRSTAARDRSSPAGATPASRFLPPWKIGRLL